MHPEEYRHMYEEEENHWWYVGMRAVVLALLPLSALPRKPRILDAGCGTGYSMLWLRQHYGASVTGVDRSADGLDFCGRRGEKALVCADVAALPFANEAFDLVTAFDVLSEVVDEEARSRALAEFLRVLRPGGGFLVRVPAFEWLRSSHDAAVMTRHRYTSGELRAALAQAGFRLSRLTFANALLFPLAVLWRWFKRAGLAPAGSDVRPGTRGVALTNHLLKSTLAAEAAILRHSKFVFPFGLSIFALAEKPAHRG